MPLGPAAHHCTSVPSLRDVIIHSSGDATRSLSQPQTFTESSVMARSMN